MANYTLDYSGAQVNEKLGLDVATKAYVDGHYVTAGQKSGTTLEEKATAEGDSTTASGYTAHAEGYYTTASGASSHAEGSNTVASGYYSHAEGSGSEASGESSHAEGGDTEASGYHSHAEGYETIASGVGSHAEGRDTEASGDYSHAEGYWTTAQRKSQHVFGEFNILDTTGTATTHGQYVEIVGKGTADNARSNARTLDWSGNEVLAGKLTVGTGPTANMDVATKQYVDNLTQYPNQPITLAAYNALTTQQKNADIVYQITDDTVGGQLATKAELTAGLATKANNSDVSTKANKASAFTVTLDDNSWNNQSQTINNINFEANGYSYIISPASTSFQDYLESQIYADDVTINGSMTFHCDTAPVVDIMVNVFKAEVV